MKKGLFTVMALLTVFAIIGCDNGSSPGPGPDNNITISFDLDGGPGTRPTPVTITKGGTLGSKYPNMEGNGTKEFLGWYNGVNQVTRDTPLSASVTLKAKWKDLGEIPVGKFRIIFNLGGASGEPPDPVDINETAEITANDIPEDPKWTGHKFDGWYNGNTKLEAGYKKTANFTADYIVFTAKWIASGLKPWAPPVADQPDMPTTGYKNFYGDVTDPDEWKYSTFAGTGNVGVIEANGDGTYNISIKTVPGGRSIVSFNSDAYMFKNGYYLLFDFPTNTEAKPIAAAVLAAAGSTNEDGAVWNTIYNVNTETGWAPTLDDVYLAGEIAFARDNLASINTLYKSVLLELVWNEDEEAESYEFTLKKILITTGEDLTPPDPNALTAWTPDPVSEPSSYVNFPGNETLTATYYPWSANTTGTTINTAAAGTGRTLIRLSGDTFAYKKGIYVSVTLPNNSLKPEKIYLYGSTTKLEGGIVWGTETFITAPAGKFIAGKVDLYWDGSASTDVLQGIILDIYWYVEQTEGAYSFTINSIKVAEEATGAPPAETPDIHETSELNDATYALNATVVTPLNVVPRWTDNSSTYTYEWWQDTSTNQSTWPAINTGVTTASFTPPTNVEGFFYYYCVVKYPAAGTQKLTRVIKITVGNPTPPEPPAEKPGIHDSSELADATYAQNATTVAPLKVVPTWTTNSSTYTFEWWQDTSLDQSTWPATQITSETTATFTPPVNVVGDFYYYCVVRYPAGGADAKTVTRVIHIEVTSP